MMRTEMTNISMTESQPARSRASRSFVTYAPTTGTTLGTIWNTNSKWNHVEVCEATKRHAAQTRPRGVPS